MPVPPLRRSSISPQLTSLEYYIRPMFLRLSFLDGQLKWCTMSLSDR
jgi:hypothetical protein